MIAYDDNDDMMRKKMKAGSFNAMDLDKNLVAGLTRMQYKIPTPVQRKTVPVALAGMDVVCMARTGSGKTAAFLIPMLQKFNAHNSTAGVRGIILSPTRELAVQTYRFAKDMAKFMDVRIISIIGGDPLEPQFEALSNRPDIIIATPGRLMHHLSEISTFTLKSCKYLVFDEADRLFEMGFAEQLNAIIKQCPEDRQTLLFSATMPRQLLQFTRAGLRDPQLIRLETDNKMSDELRMAFFTVRTNEKIAAFLYLVRSVIPVNDMTIVFTATRHHSEYIHTLLTHIGHTSTLVYGNMDQDLRANNLRDFRNGKISYLIVTDLAARGIDVPLLNNVVNLHFPPTPKLFVHRCGRAARQGRIGYAFSLVEPEEMGYMADVHMFLGKPIENLYNGDIGRAAAAAADDDEDNEDASSSSSTAAAGAVQIGRGNSKGNAGGTTIVPMTSHSKGYTLEEFVPEFVHTGLMPQDVIDMENDFVSRLQADDEEFSTMARIAENGMQQYRRTRSEASPKGVTEAKRVMKSNAIVAMHPLLVGVDPANCNSQMVEKANFIRMLQTFRPAQTVLESGIGTGTGSSIIKGKGKKAASSGGNVADGVAIMQALRKTTVDVLLRNKEKKKQLYDAFMEEQAVKQPKVRDDRVGETVSHMGPSLGMASLAGTSSEVDHAPTHKGKGKGKDKDKDKDKGKNSSRASDVWAQLEAISEREEKGAGAGDASRAMRDDGDDSFTDEYLDNPSAASESNPSLRGKSKSSKAAAKAAEGKGSVGKSQSQSNQSATSAEEVASAPRLNAADRKRLKKQGKGLNDAAAIAQLRQENSSKRERERESRQTENGSGDAEPHSQTTDGYETGSNNYADKRFYMAYGTEDLSAGFAEDSLQPHAGLKTAEAQHAAMMEAAMLDVSPDDMLAMNKAKRVLRWDDKKRKYVRQSLDEIASLKGNKKARSESGGSGSRGKSSKPVGEIYKSWAKKTHREINTYKVMADIGADIVSGGGSASSKDVVRPVVNFKNNLHVPSELKSEHQIRKEQKSKSDSKLKNLPKEKRRALEGQQRKKKNSAKKTEESKGRMVHKAARKSLKAIMR